MPAPGVYSAGDVAVEALLWLAHASHCLDTLARRRRREFSQELPATTPTPYGSTRVRLALRLPSSTAAWA